MSVCDVVAAWQLPLCVTGSPHPLCVWRMWQHSAVDVGMILRADKGWVGGWVGGSGRGRHQVCRGGDSQMRQLRIAEQTGREVEADIGVGEILRGWHPADDGRTVRLLA